MIKNDDQNNLILKVEAFIGGRDGTAIYLDRPVIKDSDGRPIVLTPQEARLRNLTYQTHLYADILIVFTRDDGTETTKEFKRVMIGAIPIMVHSDPCILHKQGAPILRDFGECMYDSGGYFIIDGKEKVIISQERVTTNRLFVSRIEEKSGDFSWRGMIQCTGESGESALVPRTVDLVIINNPDPMFDEKIPEEFAGHKGAILVSLPGVRGRIPLTTIFRALGVESDRAILEHILGDHAAAPPEFIDFIRPSLANAIHKNAKGEREPIYTQQAALAFLSRRVQYESVSFVKGLLVTDLFPNIAHATDPMGAKARFLGYLTRQLMLTALGILPPSDRDSYAFKRVDISGFLLAQLFQTMYNTFRKNVRNVLDHEYYYGPWKNTGRMEDLVNGNNLHRLFNYIIISETFVKSLKGSWGPPTDDPDQGLVQDLARISYIGFLSHLRRVNLPLDRSIKITSPHRLHAQQWGVMCPFESPDGASIGYLKNFSLLCSVTFGTDTESMRAGLRELGVIPLEQFTPAASAGGSVETPQRVMLNGDWFGMTLDPLKLTRMFRLLRRNGFINPFTSIAWDIRSNEIRVQTEPGRPCRPLLIVESGKLAAQHRKPGTTWFDWVYGTSAARTEEHYYRGKTFVSPQTLSEYEGLEDDALITKLTKTAAVIEYLDIEEENTCLIAMTAADIGTFHTHAEIHPSTIFSVVTNNIPLANHNFAPRNCFFGSQSKQAIGIYTTNFTRRFDTAAYIHHYPQRPIITTRNAHYSANDRMPNGFNAIVAVMTYTGFNQEDGIIINRASVDRGMFQITAYKSMSATAKAVNDEERTVFANPIALRDSGKAVAGIKRANYTLLNERGIISEGSYIPRGQSAAVIGMVNVRKEMVTERRGMLSEQVERVTYRDVSLTTDVHHYGKIDRVFVGGRGIGNTADGEEICKVRFRKIRRPELGDKACSRCAQKGVFGMILAPESMPFTKDGIVPDLIINPHAFPSRMTIAHLIECVYSKLCCMEGMLGDGSVFVPFDQDAMYDRLESSAGFQKHGNEILYNGQTGDQLQTEIFIGPTFYMRLKHMVTDKVHARATGPKVPLTHQPTSGRSKGGGLRIGEMERDVLLSYGMSQFTKESMMEKADKYRWAVCRRCGVLAKHNAQTSECPNCAAQETAVIETPYSFKLLSQELEAMGMQMRLSPDAFEEELEVYSDEEMYDQPMDEAEVPRQQQVGGDGLLPFAPMAFENPHNEEQQQGGAPAADTKEDDEYLDDMPANNMPSTANNMPPEEGLPPENVVLPPENVLPPDDVLPSDDLPSEDSTSQPQKGGDVKVINIRSDMKASYGGNNYDDSFDEL
jgi:DNA-directed RNA polymerase II subunit RPB2